MIKEGLSKIAIRFLYLISLLPFWFLYLIADLIFLVLFYLVKYRRSVVQTNLLRSFPEKSETERKKIEKQYFKYLADMIVESIKMITISKARANRHFKFLNIELLESYFKQGKSVLAVVGHYGNWEMAIIIGEVIKQKKLVIYKPLANKVYDDFVKKTRSRFDCTLIPMRSALRKIVESRNELNLSMFISDQTPLRHETQYYTQFLNQSTAVFLGTEKIAKMTNNPVIFWDVKVVKRGYYTCTFVPLIENPEQTTDHEITEAHVRYLEKMIRAEPQYWLWSHRRWKFDEEGMIAG